MKKHKELSSLEKVILLIDFNLLQVAQYFNVWSQYPR